MKRSILALTLALGLALTGCASMLEREYVSLSPHPQLPAAAADSDAIRVENYQQLVSALLALVDAHMETGVIRMKNYTTSPGQTAAEDLTRARDEVCQADPLGCYGVERMDTSLEHMVMSDEATVTITYRRTKEQMDGVAAVMGSRAIRTQLQSAMLGFRPELVMQTNYFYDDADYIRDLVRETYYETPAALVLPEVEVNLYPDTGYRRIVEVLFTYPDGPGVLTRRSRALATEVAAMTAPMAEERLQGDELAQALFHALRARNAAHTEAGEDPASSAYCLLEGVGDSQGLALAYKALCDEAGLECQVVEGAWDQEPHFWTIVSGEDGSRHVDPTLESGLLLTDQELQTLTGADWSRQDYPVCGDESQTLTAGY